MENQRFDDLSRMMATGASRRTLLRGLAGGALAAFGLRAGSVAARADKVDICHYDADTGTYHRINVSVNAYDAHIAHGDNGNAGCAAGYEFNMDTCACEPVSACTGLKEFDACLGSGGSGNCLFEVSTEQLVCVDVDLSCDACSEEACPEGFFCVTDFGCGGDPHCHIALE